MKTFIVGLITLLPFSSFAANTTCVKDASEYAISYVEKFYNQKAVVDSVSGNAENRGPDGYVALGVKVALEDGSSLRVISMMTPGCVLVDIMAFEI
ncbi:hypothetical protein [Peredibacter starrii]|uniref:Uncharacterized protein n=1 Tax=Peredibacter starrii TaxID=28202 RepID=A0AAX4HRE3_9BACT|nr:hypothetical protein [Peredibacter starrii]WPU65914.1 hypothetical protein SOO65_04065 [Peredibacter starrii]